MTTNSILKSVKIRKRTLAKNFIRALEMARENPSKETHIPFKVKRLGKDEIKSVFGDK